jgi:flagellar hook-associated protein 3 FlgL
MRITHQMMTNNAIRNMASNLENMTRLQNVVASQGQISKASDDPVTASLSLSLTSSLKGLADYQNTATQAGEWLSSNDFSMGKMSEAAIRAIGLVTSGLNDTEGTVERGSYANELDGILKQVLDLANTNNQGQYIYSGYQINTKPFELVESTVAGVPDSIVYHGDSGVMTRSLGPGQSVNISVDGNSAFTPLMNTLIAARDALNANDMTTLRTSLNDLQTASDTLDAAMGTNGTRMRQVDQVSDYLSQSAVEMKAVLSQKQDANLAEAISMLKNQETSYQVVLEVSQRAISALTLFDYLS